MGILVDAPNEICFYFSKMRTPFYSVNYDIKFTVYLRKVTGSVVQSIQKGHL